MPCRSVESPAGNQPRTSEGKGGRHAQAIRRAHGGSACLTSDLDAAFKESGLWPDAVLSGHAHLYERWHRVIEGRDIPYLIAGSGGYGLRGTKNIPKIPFKWAGFEMRKKPIIDYGYLLLTVDMKAKPAKLKIAFKRPSAPTRGDSLQVALS